ncbi:MAG: hypothetical protein V1875_05470 [Candidatus Altiarchaeota archaeon]
MRDEVLNSGKEDSHQIEKAIRDGWLKVSEPKSKKEYGVDEGETQALQLAEEQKDRIILDDARAIKIAQIIGLECIRTTTVVLEATASGKISRKQAITLLNQIIENGYYIAPQFYTKLAARLYETK